MGDDLFIRINKTIPEIELSDKLIDFMHLLQSNEGGFVIDTLKLGAPEITRREFKMPLTSDGLKIFKSQVEKFVSSTFRYKYVYINIHGAPADLSINYDKNEINDSDLHCQTYFISPLAYSRAEANTNFQKLVDLAVLAANSLSADFFIGGFEIGTEIWAMDSPYSDVWLLGAKSDYLPLLKKHIKTKFGLDLSTKEVQKLVKQSADFIKRKNGFTIISFMKFTKDENVNLLYKKLAQFKTQKLLTDK